MTAEPERMLTVDGDKLVACETDAVECFVGSSAISLVLHESANAKMRVVRLSHSDADRLGHALLRLAVQVPRP